MQEILSDKVVLALSVLNANSRIRQLTIVLEFVKTPPLVNTLIAITTPPSDVSKANNCRLLTGIITVQYNRIKQTSIRICKHKMHILNVYY